MATATPTPGIYGLGHQCRNCDERIDIQTDRSGHIGWVHDRNGSTYCRGEIGYVEDNGGGIQTTATPTLNPEYVAAREDVHGRTLLEELLAAAQQFVVGPFNLGDLKHYLHGIDAGVHRRNV